jgi:hypothetical protein
MGFKGGIVSIPAAKYATLHRRYSTVTIKRDAGAVFFRVLIGFCFILIAEFQSLENGTIP